MNNSTSTHYSKTMILLHWLTVILMIAVYLTIENRGLFAKGTEARDLIKYSHFVLGFGVFVLVWLRLFIRLRQPYPTITPPLVNWQHTLSKLVHILLYALMIIMPILGWLILSAAGKTLDLGLFSLPNFLQTDRGLAHDIEELHGLIGKVGYFIIGLHALAALLHHYVMKDNTLLRMLPSKRNI